MPVNSLEIENREIQEFNASLNGSTQEIEISAVYILTIKNTGILPVRPVRVGLDKISHSDSGTVFINESDEKEKSLGKLSSGESVEASFIFSVSKNVSELNDLAQKACSGSNINISYEEYISSLVLKTQYSEMTEMTVSVEECDGIITQPGSQPQEPSDSEDDSQDGEDNSQDGSEDNENDEDDSSDPTPPTVTPITVQLEGDQQLNPGISGSFTANPIETTNSAVRYVFTMGDETTYEVGSGNTNNSITHTYEEAGSYNVRVNMFSQDEDEQIASDSLEVSVVPVPPEPIGVQYAVELSGSDTVERGVETRYTANPVETTNDAVTYEFNMGDGTTNVVGSDNSDNTTTHAYTETGSYDIVLRMLDNQSGDELASDMLQVTVNEPVDEIEPPAPPAPPVAPEPPVIEAQVEIEGPDEVSAQTPNEYSATSRGVEESGIEYQFDMGDGTRTTVGEGNEEDTVSHSYDGSGGYTITVDMIDSDSETQIDSDTHNIMVTEPSGDSQETQNIDYNPRIEGPEEINTGQQGTWAVTLSEGSQDDVYHDIDMGDGTRYEDIGSNGDVNQVSHTYQEPIGYTIFSITYNSQTGEEIGIRLLPIDVSPPEDQEERIFTYSRNGVGDDANRRWTFDSTGEDQLGGFPEDGQTDERDIPLGGSESPLFSSADTALIEFDSYLDMPEDTFIRGPRILGVGTTEMTLEGLINGRVLHESNVEGQIIGDYGGSESFTSVFVTYSDEGNPQIGVFYRLSDEEVEHYYSVPERWFHFTMTSEHNLGGLPPNPEDFKGESVVMIDGNVQGSVELPAECRFDGDLVVGKMPNNNNDSEDSNPRIMLSDWVEHDAVLSENDINLLMNIPTEFQ